MSRSALSAAALALLAAAACQKKSGPSGPAVAEGEGVTITAEEFQARLAEQSPFIRQRYTTLERKKEFLENLVRFELLAREAERQGLDKDPEVRRTLQKVMVQRLVQKLLQEGDASKEVGDADAQKYYDEHKDEFVKPRRVRLSQALFAAPSGAKDRAAKSAAARAALGRVKAEEKKNPLAFALVARELSEDGATRAAGGDLGFRSLAELEAQFGKPFAEKAFGLGDGEVALVESPQGFHVVKRTGLQEELSRSFEQVKPQIQARLLRERRTRDFDEYVKGLREKAHVTVNDAELEKVAVAGAPGMPPLGSFPVAPAPPRPPAPPAAPPAPAPAR